MFKFKIAKFPLPTSSNINLPWMQYSDPSSKKITVNYCNLPDKVNMEKRTKTFVTPQ